MRFCSGTRFWHQAEFRQMPRCEFVADDAAIEIDEVGMMDSNPVSELDIFVDWHSNSTLT